MKTKDQDIFSTNYGYSHGSRSRIQAFISPHHAISSGDMLTRCSENLGFLRPISEPNQKVFGVAYTTPWHIPNPLKIDIVLPTSDTFFIYPLKEKVSPEVCWRLVSPIDHKTVSINPHLIPCGRIVEVNIEIGWVYVIFSSVADPRIPFPFSDYPNSNQNPKL